MISSKLPLAFAMAILATTANADLLSGRVVNSQGIPVANVNIQADSQGGGGDGNIANAGTDANGFFNATINPGVYDITFEPPPPRAAVALVTTVENVVVSGSTSMGTVSLGAAVVLSGRVVRAGSIPVQGVNLDVIHLATNENIDLPGDQTDALGRFSVAVPMGSIELLLDTTPILAPLLAPVAFELLMTGNVDLGDILLEPGFKVTAATFNSSFVPVQNLDVDVRDTLTGQKLYTPGDNTDLNGFVDFVVRQGVFDIEFCPLFATGLVPKVLKATNISSTTNLGIVTLNFGVQLTGTVTSHLGAAVSNVDLNVWDSATQNPVFVCNENSGANGVYRVIVPTGQYDLDFAPPYSQKLGSKSENGVFVIGNTVRNAVLPFCDCGTVSGTGTAGTGGLVPQLTQVGGSLRLGNPDWGYDLTNGLGGAKGLAFLGYGPSCGITHGQFGVSLLSASPMMILPFQLDGAPGVAGAGTHSFQFHLPNIFPTDGQMLFTGAYILDPAAPNGRALTQRLCGGLCQ